MASMASMVSMASIWLVWPVWAIWPVYGSAIMYLSGMGNMAFIPIKHAAWAVEEMCVKRRGVKRQSRRCGPPHLFRPQRADAAGDGELVRGRKARNLIRFQVVSRPQLFRVVARRVDDGDAGEDGLARLLQEGGGEHARAHLVVELRLGLDQTVLQQVGVLRRQDAK
jgi:hypothetical protein